MNQDTPQDMARNGIVKSHATELKTRTTPHNAQHRPEAASTINGRKWSEEQASYMVDTLTPPWCRFHPDRPFRFSIGLNIIFAFAACFTVANLYYSHPILNLIAENFDVTNEQASLIPTLAQAGYAVGLLLLCPLGDMLKRRPLIIGLVFVTSMLWIGLCITDDFIAFKAISFLSAVTTVTPQLMLPLVGQLAPAHRKSTALSIVTSGLLLGMLVARVLSGVVARFIGWRYIYWIALGLQLLVLILVGLFMPDYPRMNEETPLAQLPLLVWDVVKSPFQYPVLAQACVIQLCASACFGNFWTTLVFLLSGHPYNYSSLVVGLFGLIAIGSMIWAPVFARLVMDKKQPLFSTIIGLSICLAGTTIGTYAGTHSTAGPIIEASTIEIGLLTTAIANRTAIYAQAPRAMNRVNTAYMVMGFLGQLSGTAIGNAVFARHGWIASGSVAVGLAAIAVMVALIRGPHEKGWIGWTGGYSMDRNPLDLSEKDPNTVPKTSRQDGKVESATTTDAEKGHSDK